MIGYKDNYYKDIGWMSAKMDTIMNLIPARISIIFLVLVIANYESRLEKRHFDI